MRAAPVAAQAAIGAGVLVLAALLAWGATDISGQTGYSGIGPNFLPWVVVVALAACGALLLWQALRGGYHEAEEPAGAARGDGVAFLWVSAGLLANAALITAAGFVVSTAVCFVLAAQGLRRSAGKPAGPAVAARDLGVGLALSLPVYWAFTKLLSINLPGLTATGWI